MTEPHDADRDDLGWDRDVHGRMADHATGPDDEPATVPYEPEDN